MRKILAVLILGLALIGNSFAEKLTYYVNYKQYGICHSTIIDVNTDYSLTAEDALWVYNSKIELYKTFKKRYHITVIDYDSPIEEQAIVAKLDELHMFYGIYNRYVSYYKINSEWRRLCDDSEK